MVRFNSRTYGLFVNGTLFESFIYPLVIMLSVRSAAGGVIGL